MCGNQHGGRRPLGKMAGHLDGHVGGEVASLEDGVTWGTYLCDRTGGGKSWVT